MIFLIVIEKITTCTTRHCHMAENLKEKMEYLIIPMRTDGAKNMLLPTDIFSINQITFSRQPLNHLFTNSLNRGRHSFNSHPIYKKTYLPHLGQSRYPSFPREFQRDVKTHMKPLIMKPTLFRKEPYFIEDPSRNQNAVMFPNYIGDNESE